MKRNNKNTKSSSSSVFIKGYLPVRLRLPPVISNPSEGNNDSSCSQRVNETIFYVKEHHATTSSSTNTSQSTNTLFIANAPVVPYVQTQLVLKSIFGRYGEILRVTVLPKSRRSNTTDDATTSSSTTTTDNVLQFWTTKYRSNPSYLPPIDTIQGKFAHVVFATTKDMKRAMSSLISLMKQPTSADDDNKDENDDENDNKTINNTPAIVMDSIEIQTLADETDRLLKTEWKQSLRTNNDDTDDDDDDSDDSDDDQDYYDDNESDNDEGENKKRQRSKKNKSLSTKRGIMALVNRYRQSIPNRNQLLQECNIVMQQYEEEERQLEEERQIAKNQPDDDGFITVSYSNTTSGQRELEQHDGDDDDNNNNNAGGSGKRRSGGRLTTTSNTKSRSRKKKRKLGATELPDFYRFQNKEYRKKALHDLRSQFEDDLVKLQKIKEKTNTSSSSNTDISKTDQQQQQQQRFRPFD